MECPKCHLHNPPSALRCDCGYSFPLQAEDKLAANPLRPGDGHALGDALKFCGTCGKQVESAEQKFCLHCGKSVSPGHGKSPASTISSTAMSNKEYFGVEGWLRLLCIFLGILVPLYSLIRSVAWLWVLVVMPNILPDPSHVVLLLPLPISRGLYSLWIGSSLWKRKPRAVINAKVAVWVLGGSVILELLLGAALFSGAREDARISDYFGEFAYCLSFLPWYFYLNESKRVEATFK
jgi:hypothetical protein